MEISPGTLSLPGDRGATYRAGWVLRTWRRAPWTAAALGQRKGASGLRTARVERREAWGRGWGQGGEPAPQQQEVRSRLVSFRLLEGRGRREAHSVARLGLRVRGRLGSRGTGTRPHLCEARPFRSWHCSPPGLPGCQLRLPGPAGGGGRAQGSRTSASRTSCFRRRRGIPDLKVQERNQGGPERHAPLEPGQLL